MSPKKKKKTHTHTQIHEILQFFVLTKRINNKKRLIRDKVEIEHVDMKIIK